MSNQQDRQAKQKDQRSQFQKLFDRGALTWRLMMDRRVNVVSKVIPLMAVAYIFSPIDFVPELLMGPLAPLGFVDDVGILIIALNYFISISPNEVVTEHLEELKQRAMKFDGGGPEEDDVIDGDYRVR